jgi:arginine-tRNA-protein transferase
MLSLVTYTTPAGPCGYLPEQTWQLEYEIVADMSVREYQDRLLAGWRHFGHALFHPRCPSCRACQSLRVPVERFRPSRSQRRARAANEGVIRLEIGRPAVSTEKLRLHDRFHSFQTRHKGWPSHTPKDFDSYRTSFVDNPFPVTEWCYYVEDRLVGVGYADVLPDGLSAIYFFYDPNERSRSLGTFNVLGLLEEANKRGLKFVYLGYYVEGCESLQYKANYRPNEVLGPDGQWRPFRE